MQPQMPYDGQSGYAQQPDRASPRPNASRGSAGMRTSSRNSQLQNASVDDCTCHPCTAGDPAQEDYADYSLNRYGVRAPPMPFQSTPMQSHPLPSRHEEFGSQIDYDLSWMPRSDEMSDAVEPRSYPGQREMYLPQTYLPRNPNLAFAASTVGSKYLDRANAQEFGGPSPRKRNVREESLLEWFDRAVEKELQKRREGSLNVGENLVSLAPPSNVHIPTPQKTSASRVLDASTSRVDIEANLRGEQDTELMEAVDKLAKAEAMIAFDGAVRAAEKAAAKAPPELAEEAAAAGAQGFQAKLTNVVKQEIPGEKPIEVVGYVGITRPKKPKKPRFLHQFENED